MWPLDFDQTTTLVFDLIILVFLAWTVWRVYSLWRGDVMRRFSRWSRLVVAVVLAAAAFAVVYGSFVEPRRLVVNEYDLDLRSDPAAAPRTLRLAVVSDLHLGAYKGTPWAEKVTARLVALDPDAVLLAGDFVANERGFKSFRPLRGLAPRLGKFAVLGNWDYHIGAVDVRQELGSQGVKTLVNRAVSLDGLWLVGVDDLIFGHVDWGKALAAVPDGAPFIVMSHEPIGAAWASHFGARLTVSGHTHGGQVRLPFVGAVGSIPLPGRAYDEGLKTFSGMPVLITSGAGESGPRARLFNPPEIVVLNITH